MDTLNSGHDLSWLLDRFTPIGLEALNNKAEMLSRIDNKYVIRGSALQQVIDLVADELNLVQQFAPRGLSAGVESVPITDRYRHT